MDIASRLIEWVFNSPFLWMTLLGVVMWRSLIKHTIEASLAYAPLIEEKENNNLGGNLLFSFLLASAATFFIYKTDKALDILYVIGFWFMSLAFSVKGKETLGILFAAFVLGLLALFFESFKTINSILLYAGLYQAIIGILYLLGKKDTYPIMQQEKDGTIQGEHIFKTAWIMPAAAISASISNSPVVAISMIVLIFFSEIRINKETPKAHFRRNGIFATASGMLITLFSIIGTDLFAVLGIAVSLFLFLIWLIFELINNNKKKYLFVADDTGIKVLFVYMETPAYEMGIEAGDNITHINDKRIVSFEALNAFLEEKPPFIWAKYERGEKSFEGEYKDYSNGIGDLGIVAVPRNPSKYELYPRKGYIMSRLEKLFGINKRR